MKGFVYRFINKDEEIIYEESTEVAMQYRPIRKG